MIKISRLREPIRDLRYLLNQGYPMESAVNFVSNHYRLPLNERHLLARCVFSKLEAAEHLKKAIPEVKVRGGRLGIDGYNVLITLETILSGGRVIRCDDGYLRDLRAIFGKYRVTPATGRAISLLIDKVAGAKPKTAVVFFDRQVSHSGELAAEFRRQLVTADLKGEAVAASAVDMHLRDFDIAASSDRVVIKRATAVWDIPAAIIRRKKANLLDLKAF